MKITEIYENKIKTAIDECINLERYEKRFPVGSDAYFEVNWYEPVTIYKSR